MSDSEAGNLPSDASIERSLRHAVQTIHKSGKEEDLTVKRVRTRAEEELNLPSDFLKSDKKWKQKSSTIIKDAVNNLDVPEPTPTPKKAAPTPKKTAAPKKTAEPKAKDDTKKGVKRKAAAPAPKTTKRNKTSKVEDEADLDILSDEDVEPPKKAPAARRAKKVVTEDSEDEDGGDVAPKPTKADVPSDEDEHMNDAPTVPKKEDVSESEMSSLIDESPVKKKKQKAKQEKSTKKKAPAPKTKAKPKAKAPANDDPDTAEIKKLQSWLVKCGIRKVWGKELMPFDSGKEKINHLKKMLKDAGMDGRFSDEKAARIKEQRELASDLEAIQVMNETWGESAGGGGRPRRRAAQSAKPLVFKQPKFSDESEGDDNESEDADDNSEDSANDESDGGSGSGSESEAAGDDSD